jgi:hypothetical protein
MTSLRWRKSSYTGNQGDCVEVAHTLAHVRDSKQPDGPKLALDLSVFLATVKAGKLDH